MYSKIGGNWRLNSYNVPSHHWTLLNYAMQLTLQCRTMCVKESLILLLTDHRKLTLLGHLFSHFIRLLLALFCCQFIIAAHCKTDLKYLHSDISFFSSSGQTGSGKTFTMLGKSLPCLVLSNPWWEWDDSINSHVKNFHQHAHDLKKKGVNFSLSFSQGAFKLCFTKAAMCLCHIQGCS